MFFKLVKALRIAQKFLTVALHLVVVVISAVQKAAELSETELAV